ncbi:MAG: hypothetical protein C0486_14245 [Erythrobacter sp.]|nr:hypothetical protein [Erythrobacter sp.]MBA4080811.1 hypothetical protein [Erythrobacter sp.]
MFEKLAKAAARAALLAIAENIARAQAEARSGAAPRPREGGFAESAAARSGGGSAGGFGRARRDEPRHINENVTAVLKRQIPLRDEPPRSWIGGLPMLPDAIEWPRQSSRAYPDKGAIPLNFIAQIACADLPADLWGGLGPRHGWLVFFAPRPADGPRGDYSPMRVLHTAELGRERPAPADKQQVAETRYTEGYHPGPLYRRCPVDIVCMDNDPVHPIDLPFAGEETGSPMPPNLAQVLYGDAPVGPSYWNPEGRPFNRAALALMLTRAIEDRERQREKDQWTAEYRRKQAEERAAKGEPPEPQRGPGFDAEAAARALEALREEEAKLAETPEGLDAERAARRTAYVARRSAEIADQRACLGQFGAPFDSTAFANFLEQQEAARAAWLAAQEAVMRELLTEQARWPQHALIDDAAWEALDGVFSRGHDRWFLGRVVGVHVPCPEWSTLTLWDLVKRHAGGANAAVARDLYFAGPETRATLPSDLREGVEASARAIRHDRPHRMGGYHQPVQETFARPGKVMLLQMPNDDTTGMRWGDSGALFAWIGIEDLARGDFSRVEWWTENT